MIDTKNIEFQDFVYLFFLKRSKHFRNLILKVKTSKIQKKVICKFSKINYETNIELQNIFEFFYSNCVIVFEQDFFIMVFKRSKNFRNWQGVNIKSQNLKNSAKIFVKFRK